VDSRNSLLRAARTRFQVAGLEYADEDALLLVERALGLSRAERVAAPDQPVPERDASRVRDWVERYASGEPLAYLEGSVGFRRLELGVDARVLVPRPDSETLVDLGLETIGAHAAPRVVDVGTGSGCLLLSLLDECPAALGLGLDCSHDALAVAKANAAHCGLSERATFSESDWLSAAASDSADLIVSNPPYVEPGEPLGRGVAEYEPTIALFTPVDAPLHAYQALVEQAPRVLRPGGALLLEVGAGRVDAVVTLAAEYGFTERSRRRDLGGIERALLLVRD
jgi:release factor glutamine methyltransferase